MGKIKKVKHKSIKSLRKKAWKLKSEYVRRKADGKWFTCDDKRPWKEQQAGHYIHKDCLDYDEIGIQCQCVRCNKWLSGNQVIYDEMLIRKYEIKAVEKLRERANQSFKKWTVGELELRIEDLQKKRQSIQEGTNG